MLKKLLEELAPTNTALVAVSKTKPVTQIKAMYDQGQRIFGENRVQEMVQKHEDLPQDIEWHLIGQLQRNKVKYAAPFVAMIHSVDSYKLLKEINKQAAKNARNIPVLLQFKIAEEDTKAGFDPDTAKTVLDDDRFSNLQNIEICGVMGMATFTDDTQQVRDEFRRLKSIFNQLKQTYFADQISFKEISMGMSGDYPIAVEEGSTMVRIGSLLFGARE
jgi:pyridoxal phosphate enzyme (YggS family)